ncbi:hypothetical protein BH11ARM2_BH11ARM2_05420 [soil metagenome]
MDVETVRHALSVARLHGYAEVELRAGHDRFRARLEPAPPMKVGTVAEAKSEEPALLEIRSPLVGYYRAAKAPLAPGVKVTKGDRVASVEALGLLSDIESKVAGEVVELLVEEGQSVQYGQVLARVKA